MKAVVTGWDCPDLSRKEELGDFRLASIKYRELTFHVYSYGPISVQSHQMRPYHDLSWTCSYRQVNQKLSTHDRWRRKFPTQGQLEVDAGLSTHTKRSNNQRFHLWYPTRISRRDRVIGMHEPGVWWMIPGLSIALLAEHQRIDTTVRREATLATVSSI